MVQEILKTFNIAEDLIVGANSQLTKHLDFFSESDLATYNPSTENCIAHIKTVNLAGCEFIIQHSLETFQRWRTVPSPKRGEYIRQIGEALRQHKNSLSRLMSLEMGKIQTEAATEVQEMISMADLAVWQSRMLYGKTMSSEHYRHQLYEQWHPLGPVGVVTAFNFPMSVWAWNAFIAAICGNTIIWRPSTKTALCAVVIQKICEDVMKKVGFENLFSLLVIQDNALTLKLLANKALPLISFTGSVPIGRKVNEIVGNRLGKTILELSGNNAIIVDETADLELAVRAIVFSAVRTSGQRCTSARRLFIHHSCYNELLKKLIATYKTIRIGNPLDPEVSMGPLIDQAAVDNYFNALKSICSVGDNIIYGGYQLPGKGFFVAPTLVKANHDWLIVHIETFAPILYVMRYTHFEEAIAAQNAVPQGLSSSLFTQNLLHTAQFLSVVGSDCSIANINVGTFGAEIGENFDGEKETGGGRDVDSDAWKMYMRRQTNTVNWGLELLTSLKEPNLISANHSATNTSSIKITAPQGF